jgi:nucleotide-binding universal stress UspA family protein
VRLRRHAGCPSRIRDHAAAQTHHAVAELDPALEAEAVVVHGDALAELRRAASASDLMVVGSRGYGPLHGAVAGSLSGRLMGARVSAAAAQLALGA